ncbi:MGMT family protein, partial [candidate division KSB1 bacterium]|nr:MGMT family protein [candidate division KSB1 bacterium]
MSKQKTHSFHERVKALVRKIPRGKVATYGQLA